MRRSAWRSPARQHDIIELMDDKQLDEWTMQMAGGADPLTAWAATGDDKPPQPRGRSIWFQVGLVLGLILFCLWLVL